MHWIVRRATRPGPISSFPGGQWSRPQRRVCTAVQSPAPRSSKISKGTRWLSGAMLPVAASVVGAAGSTVGLDERRVEAKIRTDAGAARCVGLRRRVGTGDVVHHDFDVYWCVERDVAELRLDVARRRRRGSPRWSCRYSQPGTAGWKVDGRNGTSGVVCDAVATERRPSPSAAAMAIAATIPADTEVSIRARHRDAPLLVISCAA